MKMYSSWIERASGPRDVSDRSSAPVPASVTRGRRIPLLLITILSISGSITSINAILDTRDTRESNYELTESVEAARWASRNIFFRPQLNPSRLSVQDTLHACVGDLFLVNRGRLKPR